MTATQLFEPVPIRRAIVPEGWDSWWGVDVGTKAVSVASVTGSPENGLQRRVTTFSFPHLRHPARLFVAHEEIVVGVKRAILDGALPRPGFVFVEQPGMRNMNWELATMYGVVLAAVPAGVAEVQRSRVPVIESVVPARWKKLSCGNGAIPKRDPATGKPWRDREDYPVMKWARDVGYDGPPSWDCADAMGVAEAARLTVVLDPR